MGNWMNLRQHKIRRLVSRFKKLSDIIGKYRVSREVERVFFMVLGVHLMAVGIFHCYYDLGWFKLLGFFDKMPIYQWRPERTAVVLSLFMIAIGMIVYAVSLRFMRRKTKAMLAVTLILLIVGVPVLCHLSSRNISRGSYKPAFVTDAYVLQIEAARSLIHGLNPYKEDYAKALLHRMPRGGFYTWVYNSSAPPYTVNKIVGFVHYFDYLLPAALYYVPAVLLGLPGYVWNVIVLTIELILVFRRVRALYRTPIPALLLLSTLIYLRPAVERSTISGWIVPLALAMAYPDNPLIAGFMLAWASTYRLYVGVLALFYLIAVYYEGYDAKKIFYTFLFAGLILNLPPLLIDPRTFIGRVLIPIKLNLNPLDMGPGLTDLYYLGLTITKQVSDILAVVIIIVGLLATFKYYLRMSYTSFLIPTLALIVYYRTSYVYYLYYPIMATIGYATGFFKRTTSNVDYLHSF